MINLYSSFGDALDSFNTHIGNKDGSKTKVDASSIFLRSLDAAFLLTYRPMCVEERRLSGWSYHPVAEEIQMEIGNGISEQWKWAENLPRKSWTAQIQEAFYLPYLSSDSQGTQYLKKIYEYGNYGRLTPFNHSLMPQARKARDFGDGTLSSLSTVTYMPWFGNQTIGELASQEMSCVNDFYLVHGQWFPSAMDRQWFQSGQNQLMELVNTKTIELGGGWTWISPQSRSVSHFDLTQLRQACGNWEPLSTQLSNLDTTISIPYSICGQAVSEFLYNSDAIVGTQRDQYDNCPILLPLDQFRHELCATVDYNTEHSLGLEILYSQYRFADENEIQALDKIALGTDVYHWGSSWKLRPKPQPPEGLSNLWNLSAEYPEWSFSAKPSRDSNGELQVQTIRMADVGQNLAIPPFRLVGENAYALLYLWNSFLAGSAQSPSYARAVNAYSQMVFNRPHFFKDYQFQIVGQATALEGANGWTLSVSQEYSIQRWSQLDGSWSPLSVLAEHEPALGNVGPNELKFYNSVGSSPQEGTLPLGSTTSTYAFRLGLPVILDYDSTIGGLFVEIDTTYFPERTPLTEEEWKDLVEDAKKLFPKSGSQLKNDALSSLEDEYYGEDGILPTLSATVSNLSLELSNLVKEYETLSTDAWNDAWNTALDNTWNSTSAQVPDFNNGITDDGTWQGHDPTSFQTYLNWRRTYYGTVRYNVDTNGHLYRQTGSFDEDSPSENWNWSDYVDDMRQYVKDYGNDVYSSPKYKDGQYQGFYYSNEMQTYISGLVEQLASTLCSDADFTPFSESLQALNNQYPPLTCTITTDPVSHDEQTHLDIDQWHWASTIIDINNVLEGAAEDWILSSQTNLGNAFNGWGHGSLSSNSAKMVKVNEVKSSVENDGTLNVEWNYQYSLIMEEEGEPLLEEISDVRSQYVQAQASLIQKTNEYSSKRQQIELSSFQNGPLPSLDVVNRFVSMNTATTPPLSTTHIWQTSISLFALMPDNADNPLTSYTSPQEKMLNDYYDCISPKTRWPTGHSMPTTYATTLVKREPYFDSQGHYHNDPVGKIHLEYVSSNSKAFDVFRENLMKEMETEATTTLGSWPTEANYYGEEVKNPQRWTIPSTTISVDTLESGTPTDHVAYELTTFYVSFAEGLDIPPPYECVGIDMYSNRTGIHFYTSRATTGNINQDATAQSSWKLIDPPNLEYCGQTPVEGEDFELPEINREFNIKAGTYVLGQAELQSLQSSLPQQ